MPILNFSFSSLITLLTIWLPNFIEIGTIQLKCQFNERIYVFEDSYAEKFRQPAQNFYSCYLVPISMDFENGSITIDRSEYIDKNNYKELVEIWFKGLLTIPPVIFQVFPNLNFLSVRGTNLTELEASTFQNASKLSKAWISENNFYRLNASTFIGAPNLEYLSLSSNRIEMLDEKAFTGLSKLKALYLRINELENLGKNIFAGLKSLEVLDLSDNKLSTLQFNLLANGKLSKVSFLHNEIHSIDPKIFDEKVGLDLVDLMGNECVDAEFDGLRDDVMKLKAGLLACFMNHTEITGDVYYRIDKGLEDMNAKIADNLTILYGLVFLLFVLLIGVCSAVAIVAYQINEEIGEDERLQNAD